MSTVTQFIDLMNREKMPDEMERHIRYTHLEIDKEMIALRRLYRRNMKRQSKQSEMDLR